MQHWESSFMGKGPFKLGMLVRLVIHSILPVNFSRLKQLRTRNWDSWFIQRGKLRAFKLEILYLNPPLDCQILVTCFMMWEIVTVASKGLKVLSNKNLWISPLNSSYRSHLGNLGNYVRIWDTSFLGQGTCKLGVPNTHFHPIILL